MAIPPRIGARGRTIVRSLTVDVLAVEQHRQAETGEDWFDVRLVVDGQEHLLRAIVHGSYNQIPVLEYVASLDRKLFGRDDFFSAAIARLIWDIVAGERIEFPLRLEEVGPGARFRKPSS